MKNLKIGDTLICLLTNQEVKVLETNQTERFGSKHIPLIVQYPNGAKMGLTEDGRIVPESKVIVKKK